MDGARPASELTDHARDDDVAAQGSAPALLKEDRVERGLC